MSDEFDGEGIEKERERDYKLKEKTYKTVLTSSNIF